ncbi:MAG: DEAD/DEAH box helicase [Kiritimatiellia bacterium]
MVKEDDVSSSGLFLRPDGHLGGTGFDADDGAGLLALLTGRAPSGDAAARSYFRRLAADHVRRLVVAAEDGRMPTDETLARVRSDALARLALLAALPPMTGGEYWTDGTLCALYDRLETAIRAATEAAGGDFLAFVRSLGAGWRDVGKVTLHLAENKGDRSGTRPFAFLATFVHQSDADGQARHLPLSAALKAFAARPAALKRILAPLEEAGRTDSFLAGLLESRRIFQPCALTIAEAYRFLKGITGYETAGLLVRTGRLWAKQPTRAQVTVSVGKTPGGGLTAQSLCSFDAAVTVNGASLSSEELETLMNARDGLVRIRGEWVAADPAHIRELLDRWQAAKRLAGQDGITMAQALRLLAGGGLDGVAAADSDADGATTVRATGELRDLLHDLLEPEDVRIATLPNGLDAVLRPYQRVGVDYLRRTTGAGLGACLADDMGLGKTLQVLTLIDLWKQRGEIAPLPVLIVMPASLLANWRAEAAKFTPDLKVGVVHPSDAAWREWAAAASSKPSYPSYLGRYDLVLTTYGQFTRLKELAKLPFAAVIADEAQAIKNPGSGQSRALRAVVSPRRLALTGTPVENRLTDLWSIFDFINPGLLGSLTSFTKATAKTTDFSVVRRLTRPFILRRLKTDKSIIADLPDKTELDVSTALSPKQALLYRRTVEELRRALDEMTGEEGVTIKRRGLVLAYMLKFKQICDHPSLYLGTEAFRPEDSGKFLVLGERAAEVASRQEKMLVFTQYREMTGPLADYLATVFGREGLVLHGGTPVATRGKLVKAFQDPYGPPFFVLSVKAAGTGLTLTAANHVVHFDRWWNPAVENQASDRAYRIGQRRNVLIHKFVTPGTLEERIDAMIKEKQALADSLFSDGGEKLITEMSDADLMDFVKLRTEDIEQ